LLELKVMGRSPRTIKWYEQKLDWYFRADGVVNLEALTAFELKRFLAEQQERGLSDNTIHGFFQVIRTFANWCLREEYPVDRTLLRVRPPKVALKEMSTYTEDQVSAIFNAAPAGWPQLAVRILLGTGVRVGELSTSSLRTSRTMARACSSRSSGGRGPSSAACRPPSACAGRSSAM